MQWFLNLKQMNDDVNREDGIAFMHLCIYRTIVIVILSSVASLSSD